MTAALQHDLLDIIADHREVEDVFGQIEKSADDDERRALVEHAITAIRRSLLSSANNSSTARNWRPPARNRWPRTSRRRTRSSARAPV